MRSTFSSAKHIIEKLPEASEKGVQVSGTGLRSGMATQPLNHEIRKVLSFQIEGQTQEENELVLMHTRALRAAKWNGTAPHFTCTESSLCARHRQVLII